MSKKAKITIAFFISTQSLVTLLCLHRKMVPIYKLENFFVKSKVVEIKKAVILLSPKQSSESSQIKDILPENYKKSGLIGINQLS
jgi:hypothetical protein